MPKRLATSAEIEEAPTLSVTIPISRHASDTISWGERPEVYGAADLRKVAGSPSNRTTEFERRLVALYWALGEPVPFLFRTADGKLRSLDAGCLGYLANRSLPDVLLTEQGGVVVAVEPTGALIARAELMRPSVESMIQPGSQP